VEPHHSDIYEKEMVSLDGWLADWLADWLDENTPWVVQCFTLSDRAWLLVMGEKSKT
jgi:hypothetical protein